MVNVPTNRILSDPRKIGRHYFVLEPFLPEDIRFRFNDQKNQGLLDIAKEFSRNKRITSGVRIYRDLHKMIRDELSRLQGKRVLFVNGISCDQSGDRIGYDLYSTRNRSSDHLIDLVDDDWIIIPVAPFFTPSIVRDKCISHMYTDIIDKINIYSDSRGLGESRKDKGEDGLKMGFYQFDEALYKIEKALYQIGRPEDVHPEHFKEELRGYINFNRHLLAIMYANISDMIPLEHVVEIHATKSSYAYHVVDLASKYSKTLRLSGWSAYEDMEFPDETDTTVLRRLKKRMDNLTYKNDKKRLRDLL